MKVLANTTIYAIRALIYLLKQDPEKRFISIKDISNDLAISFHFLTKIFQTLTQAGILTSYRGPSGGVALAQDPKDIKLINLVMILEGEDFFGTCMLGLPGCGIAAPCPVHDMWAQFKSQFKDKLESSSILDLKNMGGRISLESIMSIE